MFHSRSIIGFVLVASLVSVADADEIYIAKGTYAAIAFSPSTGSYGYSYNYGCRSTAERAALDRCKGSDKKVVTWVRYGFCALVKGPDGSWGSATSYGVGASNLNAIDKAKNECRKHTKSPRLVVVLSSDGQYIESF